MMESVNPHSWILTLVSTSYEYELFNIELQIFKNCILYDNKGILYGRK